MIRHEGTIELLSPLIHGGDDKEGTATPFRRMKYLVGGRIVEIPIMSGNAIRGILRRVAMDRYLELIGYTEQLSEPLYYALFSGGALEKGAATHTIDLPMVQSIRNNIPPLSVFGAAMANFIMEGKLEVGMGVPIAIETEGYTGRPGNHSIWELLGDTYYTRRDDLREQKAGHERGDDTAHQMKYEFEYLAAGTQLAHIFVLRQTDPVETACFYDTMKQFEDGRLGGRAGIGHGKFKWSYQPPWGNEEPYVAYCHDNAEDMRKFLHDLEVGLWKARLKVEEKEE